MATLPNLEAVVQRLAESSPSSKLTNAFTCILKHAANSGQYTVEAVKTALDDLAQTIQSSSAPGRLLEKDEELRDYLGKSVLHLLSNNTEQSVNSPLATCLRHLATDRDTAPTMQPALLKSGAMEILANLLGNQTSDATVVLSAITVAKALASESGQSGQLDPAAVEQMQQHRLLPALCQWLHSLATPTDGRSTSDSSNSSGNSTVEACRAGMKLLLLLVQRSDPSLAEQLNLAQSVNEAGAALAGMLKADTPSVWVAGYKGVLVWTAESRGDAPEFTAMGEAGVLDASTALVERLVVKWQQSQQQVEAGGQEDAALDDSMQRLPTVMDHASSLLLRLFQSLPEETRTTLGVVQHYNKLMAAASTVLQAWGGAASRTGVCAGVMQLISRMSEWAGETFGMAVKAVQESGVLGTVAQLLIKHFERQANGDEGASAQGARDSSSSSGGGSASGGPQGAGMAEAVGDLLWLLERLKPPEQEQLGLEQHVSTVLASVCQSLKLGGVASKRQAIAFVREFVFGPDDTARKACCAALNAAGISAELQGLPAQLGVQGLGEGAAGDLAKSVLKLLIKLNGTSAQIKEALGLTNVQDLLLASFAAMLAPAAGAGGQAADVQEFAVNGMRSLVKGWKPHKSDFKLSDEQVGHMKGSLAAVGSMLAAPLVAAEPAAVAAAAAGAGAEQQQAAGPSPAERLFVVACELFNAVYDMRQAAGGEGGDEEAKKKLGEPLTTAIQQLQDQALSGLPAAVTSSQLSPRVRAAALACVSRTVLQVDDSGWSSSYKLVPGVFEQLKASGFFGKLAPIMVKPPPPPAAAAGQQADGNSSGSDDASSANDLEDSLSSLLKRLMSIAKNHASEAKEKESKGEGAAASTAVQAALGLLEPVFPALLPSSANSVILWSALSPAVRSLHYIMMRQQEIEQAAAKQAKAKDAKGKPDAAAVAANAAMFSRANALSMRVAATLKRLLEQMMSDKQAITKIADLISDFTNLQGAAQPISRANIDQLYQQGVMAQLLVVMQHYLDDTEILFDYGGVIEVFRRCMRDYVEARPRLRDIGAIPAFIRICNQYPTTYRALNVLMNMARSEAMHMALKQAGVIEATEKALSMTNTGNETVVRQYGALVTIAHVCGDDSTSPDDQKALALLEEYDISSIIEHIMKSACVSGNGSLPGDSSNWSDDLEAVAHASLSLSRTASNAKRLVQKDIHKYIVTALGNQYGKRPSVAVYLCRTLLNMAQVPELHEQLKAAGALEALQGFTTSDDMRTSDAAKGALLMLGSLQDDAAKAGLQASAAAPGIEGGAGTGAGGAGGGSGSAAGGLQYEVFLSHKRTDAKDFARALYNLLVLRGISCFLDFEYREDLSDLGEIVGRCRNFIFILTDNIFDSPWCRIELEAAVRHGTNIILLTKDGSRWKDAAGNAVCTFPPDHLIRQLKPEVQKVFNLKHIPHSDEYYSAFVEQLLGKIKRLQEPQQPQAQQPGAVSAGGALPTDPSMAASGNMGGGSMVAALHQGMPPGAGLGPVASLHSLHALHASPQHYHHDTSGMGEAAAASAAAAAAAAAAASAASGNVQAAIGELQSGLGTLRREVTAEVRQAQGVMTADVQNVARAMAADSQQARQAVVSEVQHLSSQLQQVKQEVMQEVLREVQTVRRSLGAELDDIRRTVGQLVDGMQGLQYMVRSLMLMRQSGGSVIQLQPPPAAAIPAAATAFGDYGSPLNSGSYHAASAVTASMQAAPMSSPHAATFHSSPVTDPHGATRAAGNGVSNGATTGATTSPGGSGGQVEPLPPLRGSPLTGSTRPVQPSAARGVAQRQYQAVQPAAAGSGGRGR